MARAAAATEAGGPRGTPDKRVFLCTRVNLGDRARWRHGRAPVRHRAIVPWCGVDSEASIEGGLDILSSGPIQRRLLPSSEFSLAIPNSARRRPCVPSRCGGITSEELKRGGRLARDTCRCPGGAAVRPWQGRTSAAAIFLRLGVLSLRRSVLISSLGHRSCAPPQ